MPSRVESPKSSIAKLCWPGVVVVENGVLTWHRAGAGAGVVSLLAVVLRGILEALDSGVFLMDDDEENGPPERDRLRFFGSLIGEVWPSGLNGTFEMTVFAKRGSFAC
jgi:hypothetical protein